MFEVVQFIDLLLVIDVSRQHTNTYMLVVSQWLPITTVPLWEKLPINVHTGVVGQWYLNIAM